MNAAARCRVRGFTIVEVLVALAVVALTLIGSYLLFTRTLQQHQRGVHHGSAVLAARSVASAMQAAGVGRAGDPARCAAGDAVACNALERGERLVEQARERVRSALPHGALSVRRLPDGRLDIRVDWREPGSPARHRVALTTARG